MKTAFKEWATVDKALGTGQQTVLLRKGGIAERDGRFAVEHDRFVIYPTYSHQTSEWLKAPFADQCGDDRKDPSQVTLQHLAEVVEILQAPPSPDSAEAWADFHIYSPALIEKRYRYKPDRPLYLLLVRVHRLATPIDVTETAAYAGCRSWVDLAEDVIIAEANPVLDDAAFDRQRASLHSALATAH